MTSVVEKVKETLHLGRHSTEQKHETPVHTAAAGGDAHIAGQHKAASEPSLGSVDAAGHVEQDRGYPAGISAVPAKSKHEPIAPAKGVTTPPEVPPGPAGEVGYGTAGEGVAAVDAADQEAAVTQDRKAKGVEGDTARGPVCDQKFVSTFEDRPVEKEIVERILEHHPVEKKFVVETRPLGGHEIAEEVKVETLGVREEIIAAAESKSPCQSKPVLMTQPELAAAAAADKQRVMPATPPPTPATPGSSQPLVQEQSEVIKPHL